MDTVVSPIESADDPALEQAFQVETAAPAADRPDFPPPCWSGFRGVLTHPWPGQSSRHFLAAVDGVPAGFLAVDLPQLDNLENADVQITVHPEHRRRGVGRALYDQAVA